MGTLKPTRCVHCSWEITDTFTFRIRPRVGLTGGSPCWGRRRRSRRAAGGWPGEAPGAEGGARGPGAGPAGRRSAEEEEEERLVMQEKTQVLLYFSFLQH